MLIRNVSLISIAILTAVISSSCSNKGSAPGGADLNLPQVTQPVTGASLYSVIHTQATTGFSLNSQGCTACGSGEILQVWSLASIFVFQGKLADMNSCMIKAMASADAIQGLTSGEYKYMTSSSSQTKVKITADGSDVKSFEIFGCNSGRQTQYMTGTNTSGSVVFNLRMASPDASNDFFLKMDATGTLAADSTWTSKNLNASFYFPSASNASYSQFIIDQKPDYMDISGVIDRGTLGTLDTNDYQLVSRVQLIGNSVRTYALGDGSVRIALGGAGAATKNWNGDTGVVGSGPTTYDSAVSAATLPSIPTTRATAFAASESWDCSVSSDAANLDQIAASNSALLTAVQACMGDFQ